MGELKHDFEVIISEGNMSLVRESISIFNRKDIDLFIFIVFVW